MKLAVLFPGIGYTCEKPLLYYSAKLCVEAGYEVIRLSYDGFPPGVKGDAEKMRQCFLSALEQTEEKLRDVDWKAREDIVFIGKSVGTVVAACYAKKHGLNVRCVLLTPVTATFAYTAQPSIVFHGTGDPWAKTPEITAACERQRLPLYLTEGANHSLETGNVERDLDTLKKTVDAVRTFLA